VNIQSVTESITKHLRDLIITGELEPGTKINEIEISNEMGVSRPPLREAFRRLENENLIVAKPRRGVFVAEMSISNCENIYEARTMLECEAIRIIEQKEVRAIPEVERALEKEKNYVPTDVNNAKEILKFFTVMSAFHKKMIEAAENEWINHFYISISSSLTRYQVLYLHIIGSRETSIADHMSIYDKIKKGRYREAKEETIEHINKTKILLEKELCEIFPDACAEQEEAVNA